MKKVIVTVGALVIIGISAFSASPAYANTQIESKIAENQQEQSKVNEQIVKLEKAIEENQKTVAKTEEDIKLANEKIELLKEEQATIEDKIGKREELIKTRLQVMQQGGGTTGYIDVILGASNFDDFISRVSAIATITKADQDLIGEQQRDKESLKAKEKAEQEQLAELNDLKLEYEGMQAHIAEQKAQAETIKEQLKNEEQQLVVEKQEEERRAAEAALAAALAESQAAEKQAVNSTEATHATGNSTAVESTAVKNSTSSNSGNDTSNKAGTDSKEEAKSNADEKNKNTEKSSPAPSSNGGNAIATVTSVGNRFIGNSVYVFGAQDPANGRFDCSGFVNWAFKQAGINIGRSTSVLSSQGTKVSTSDMRAGDLVFFDTYKKNGHVGIYLGGGKFIGSQGSTGVAVANMTSGYWKEHFDGHVRRVIQ